MKAYFIYKKTEDEPYLYAVTESKLLLKSFLKERKKNMFAFTEKELTKKEWYKFISKHEKYLLGEKGFYTNSPSDNSMMIITITSTMKEEEDVYLKSDYVFLEIGKHTSDIAYTFNNEIIEALKDLYYFDILKFKRYNEEEDSFIFREIDPYEIFNHKIDSFNIFCFLFGNTINFTGLTKQIEKHAYEHPKYEMMW